MTSLRPGIDVLEYTDEDLARYYPSDLKLKMVQVLFRHGERTPVRVRLENAGIPAHWNMCHASQEFKSAVRLPDQAATKLGVLQYKRAVETMDSHSKPILAAVDSRLGTCVLGELTDKGRRTTLDLGVRLRTLYVERLGFMPRIESADQIYLRASPMPRALESLQQVLTGFYPQEYLSMSEIPTIRLRNFTEENLYPNEGQCRRLGLLASAYAKKAAVKWNPILAGRTTDLFSPYIDGPVAIDGEPRLSGLMDTINASIGNEVQVPSAFKDQEMLKVVEQAAVEEWFGGYLASHTYRRLGAGRLLGDIKDRMSDVLKGDPLKICLYGAHDTTLGACLASLGSFDHRWPPFTSHIAFELFEKPSSGFLSLFTPNSKRHFVRLRYNDKIVSIPGCHNPQLCTYAEFESAVNALVPDWKNECQVDKDEEIVID